MLLQMTLNARSNSLEAGDTDGGCCLPPSETVSHKESTDELLHHLRNDGSDAARRLMRDFKNIQKEIAEGFTAASDGRDMKKWTAPVIGPLDTPWERGIFRLSLGFPDNYAYNPYGLVCLDILQRNWSPLNDAPSILISIQKAPEYSDPIFLCEPRSWAVLSNEPPSVPSPCERVH
jgi:hypothetical protein